MCPSLGNCSPISCSMMHSGLSEGYLSNCIPNTDFYRNNNLSLLYLEFTWNELETYTAWRKLGLSKATIPQINKASAIFWNSTQAEISKFTVEALRRLFITKYQCEYATGKLLIFTKAFLKYLTKIRLDTRYQGFEIFLHKPEALKKNEKM